MSVIKNLTAGRVWAGFSGFAACGSAGHFALKRKEGKPYYLRDFAIQNTFGSLSAMLGMVWATSGVHGLRFATRVIATGMTGAATSIPMVVILTVSRHREPDIQKKIMNKTLAELSGTEVEKRVAQLEVDQIQTLGAEVLETITPLIFRIPKIFGAVAQDLMVRKALQKEQNTKQK